MKTILIIIALALIGLLEVVIHAGNETYKSIALYSLVVIGLSPVTTMFDVIRTHDRKLLPLNKHSLKALGWKIPPGRSHYIYKKDSSLMMHAICVGDVWVVTIHENKYNVDKNVWLNSPAVFNGTILAVEDLINVMKYLKIDG